MITSRAEIVSERPEVASGTGDVRLYVEERGYPPSLGTMPEPTIARQSPSEAECLPRVITSSAENA